jgi:hypothetical protein
MAGRRDVGRRGDRLEGGYLKPSMSNSDFEN